MKYYTYDNDGLFKAEVEAEEQPENSSEFAPPEKTKGLRPWFDGLGWRMIADYASFSLEEARQLAADALTDVSFVYEGDQEYSPAERDTFDAQYQEAVAVKNGESEGVYISALMGVYGLSAGDMADKILARRDARDKAQAQFNARVQATRLRIKNATSVKALPSAVAIIKLQAPVPAVTQ